MVNLKLKLPDSISVQEAIELQQKLAPQVSEESDLPAKISNLVGCDATYFRGITSAAATLVDYEKLELLKTIGVEESTRFPYIPWPLSLPGSPICSARNTQLEAEIVCVLSRRTRRSSSEKIRPCMFRGTGAR